MADSVNPSGINTPNLIETAQGLRLSSRWKIPNFASAEAKNVFRSHPDRPVLYRHRGENYVFVVENRRGGGASPPDAFWGVNVRTGDLVARDDRMYTIWTRLRDGRNLQARCPLRRPANLCPMPVQSSETSAEMACGCDGLIDVNACEANHAGVGIFLKVSTYEPDTSDPSYMF